MSRREVRTRVWAMRLGLAGLSALVLAGCTTPEAEPDVPAIVEPEPRELPTYAQVADAQNRRVAMLERVWAATTAVVTYEDQDGQVRTEQAEGYLQVIQPRNVALSLGKQITTEVYFYLGSNDEQYWWMDRLDPERRVAYVGTHEAATPERAARFGAPVHPLDLLDLLGITALPAAIAARPEPAVAGRPGSAGAAAPVPGGRLAGDPTLPEGSRLAWSPDGSAVVVDVPGRFGTRRTWFDSATLMPRRVEMLDDRGRIAVYSRLGRDVLVSVRGDSRLRPMMADSVEVFIPGTQTSVQLRLDRIENRRERQSAAPFDRARVFQAYPVDRVEDLDLWEPEQPEGRSEVQVPEVGGERRVPDRRLRVTPRGG